MKPITTIDDVIEALDSIIDECHATENTLGYFAVLYKKVTVKVKKGISSGFFENGPRMEKLDVVFAKRYIDAYFAWKEDETVTSSWKKAFSRTKDKKLLVIQHLLLGMNAHINLDLGIAAVEVAGKNRIEELENDFNKINDILALLVDDVQKGLSSIWPFLRKILKLSGKVDNYLVDFSMKIARDGAWKFATELAAFEIIHRPEQIKLRDEKVAAKSTIITSPGKWVLFLLWFIRLTESSSVAQNINKLKQ
ncbi:MAG TPA: DUF5995 family protein [Draconibacterium sp.]|nr:DUF5995 family protein [Draconibacterium sp.]